MKPLALGSWFHLSLGRLMTSFIWFIRMTNASCCLVVLLLLPPANSETIVCIAVNRLFNLNNTPKDWVSLRKQL